MSDDSSPPRREVEGWAQIQRVNQNEGGRAFHDGELADYGLTVADAIRFTLEHYRRLRASVPLEQAIILSEHELCPGGAG